MTISRRLATIDRDISGQLGLSSPPKVWDADWVRWRLVEAYRIEQRLPGGNHRLNSGFWPAHPYEFSDVAGWAENEASERVQVDWSTLRGGVYASEISRLEQAHEWLRVELRHQPIERACLASWAVCVAYKRSLRALMLRRRWSRTSFYRRVLFGSEHIAVALQSAKLEVS